MQDEKLLTISGVWKTYAEVVLSDVHFDLHPGEVHALVGENGAGKSTLARIIAGLTKPDAGTMYLKGLPFTPETKAEAERCGVRIVLQELNLVDTLTIAENIFIDRMPHRFGWIDYDRLNRDAKEMMNRVGLANVAPTDRVQSLGVGQRQLVEIAAGLSRRCNVLVLDEPTAALTDAEVNLLFIQLEKLKASRVGLIYISHRLEEVQRIADRITVLRDGKLVSTDHVSQLTIQEIVRRMVGRELEPTRSRRERRAGDVALRISGLSSGQAVRDVSFEVHRREILGFAGLMGSGRTETMRALFGADRAEAGHIYLHGSDAPIPIRSPSDAVKHGIALLTEDRKEQGLLPPLSIRANITLTRLRDLTRWGGWLRSAAERLVAAHFIKILSLRCSSTEQPVAELSGGNQQKVVIAKWIYRNCDVLIFDEPTRGIDVAAKFEVYRLMEDLADEGKAIILVSSDLKELITRCDRIAVMSAGHLVATFKRDEWSQDKIIMAALGGGQGLEAHDSSTRS